MHHWGGTGIGKRNAMELLRRQHGNPQRLLATYRMEIKHMSPSNMGIYQNLENCLIF